MKLAATSISRAGEDAPGPQDPPDLRELFLHGWRVHQEPVAVDRVEPLPGKLHSERVSAYEFHVAGPAPGHVFFRHLELLRVLVQPRHPPWVHGPGQPGRYSAGSAAQVEQLHPGPEVG